MDNPSYAVIIPKEYFEAHDIDPEKGIVALAGNRHLIIYNPKDRKKITEKWYKETDDEVKKEIKKSEEEIENL